MKMDYENQKSIAVENNNKYLPKGISVKNGAQASKPGSIKIEVGQGFKDVTEKKYPMSEYPKKAMGK